MSSSCVVEKMTCRHLEHANKSAAWDQMKKTMWWCMNFRSKCFSQHCSALLHISVKATDVLRGTFGRALSSWSSFADPGLERETESWQGETPHPLGDTMLLCDLSCTSWGFPVVSFSDGHAQNTFSGGNRKGIRLRCLYHITRLISIQRSVSRSISDFQTLSYFCRCD